MGKGFIAGALFGSFLLTSSAVSDEWINKAVDLESQAVINYSMSKRLNFLEKRNRFYGELEKFGIASLDLENGLSLSLNGNAHRDLWGMDRKLRLGFDTGYRFSLGEGYSGKLILGTGSLTSGKTSDSGYLDTSLFFGKEGLSAGVTIRSSTEEKRGFSRVFASVNYRF